VLGKVKSGILCDATTRAEPRHQRCLVSKAEGMHSKIYIDTRMKADL
jgi:hypothetical protein